VETVDEEVMVILRDRFGPEATISNPAVRWPEQGVRAQ
jgi:hypothetical protein